MLSVGNFTENILKSGRKCIILVGNVSSSFLFVICIIKMTGGMYFTYILDCESFLVCFPLPSLKVKHKKLNFDPSWRVEGIDLVVN